MNWRAWLARFNLRERRLIIAAAALLGAALIKVLVLSPFLTYRAGLREEIAANRDMLENAHAYLARAEEVARQRDLLRSRFKEIRTQLVPGETPTLAAASLQDTLHSVAVEKGVNIQSTQVMRDEMVGDFRRVAVRITATGDLRQLADFLAAVEYGPRRVTVPFVELSRKGAVLRGQNARTLAATVEVSAFLQTAAADDAGSAAGEGGPATDAEGAPAANAEGAPATNAEGTPAASAEGTAAAGAAGVRSPAAGATAHPPAERPVPTPSARAATGALPGGLPDAHALSARRGKRGAL